MLILTDVFGMAGLSGNTNLVASSIQYVINVFMTAFTPISIDRWGRRGPLIIGALLMATWMYANAGLISVVNDILIHCFIPIYSLIRSDSN
jgi:hypothetical protein